jgi:cobalt-zinc-cadmium efflux system membrane fusion protein
MKTFRRAPRLFLSAIVLALAACGEQPQPGAEAEHPEAAAEFERGPHNGRILRDGDFAVEMTIFEEGVPPEFHIYAYENNEPVDPRQVQLSVTLSRLGGKVDRFAFHPQNDYLRGQGTVVEPHSFDVAVTAVHEGTRHNWQYASYEGRTTISAEAANSAGVKVERAGPAEIEEAIDVAGRVELQPQGRSEVRAWYPGRILAMTKVIGQPVRRGEIVARVESSESLQTYSIPAPMAGVVTERNANVGDVASDAPIYVISDPTKLHAEFALFPRDAERVRVGQPAEVRSLSGEQRTLSDIEVLLPATDPASQTLTAHVELPNTGGVWRPGMGVEGSIVVAKRAVPLAVRTRALQRFRDFTVVYARYGNTYEVRMLELGRQTPEWTEVLGGLEPGTEYVTDNAFLIRADVEKSGAAHDH